jgi:hypothetical protein
MLHKRDGWEVLSDGSRSDRPDQRDSAAAPALTRAGIEGLPATIAAQGERAAPPLH